MNTGLRITAFTAALAAAFGTAYGVGQSLEPAVADRPPAHDEKHSGASAHPEGGGHAGHGTSPAGGLQISEQGYALDLDTPRARAGEPARLRFRIRDDQGRTVTDYRREHDKELHLIVASRDLLTFRHLHPQRAADGTWSTTADLPRAGGYRIFADFTPARQGARNLTLGADLAVSGPYRPRALPEAGATAHVDGYEVRLTGTLRPGRASDLRLTVSRDGRPVTDLQPYLGAYGHLVALRSGDLAYLHVHPHGEPGDGTTKPGPDVSFTATAPSSGSYRLFLDFRHDGVVRTAAFTVHTGTPGTSTADPDTQPADPDGATPEHPGSDGGHDPADGHGH
ncbi:DUF748 domain-containing protein [Streptomyces sp. SID9913]|uniref:DUF748 domain-containing protein n=1 Tax=Streptomyces sp. SID9913 TaxID=2706117 RepID=UPI0013DAA4E1|nr:DUF748 domain-containing protein [Streptomyces sp. SID9913]MBM7088788.1 hypothetical protein [Streptomyces sp. S12]NED20930.1 DUF748 domain-containing protein [Streptomyces sp. SID9913]